MNELNKKKLTFAFIGSGPSSLFLINKLVNCFKNIKIDIFEKNIYPFGLIRNGIAPDHQNNKIIQNKFLDFLIKNNNIISYYGNISINPNIINKFTNLYSYIILAIGATKENKLNISGENNKYIYSANKIAKWYNCNDIKNINYNKFNKDCIIIGNGNVSLDILRILAIKNINELKNLDINNKRLKELNKLKNHFDNYYVLSRNNIENISFNTSMFRELIKESQKNNINIYFNKKDLNNIKNYNNRKLKLIYESNNLLKNINSKNIYFLFNILPLSIKNNNFYYKNIINNKTYKKPFGLFIKSIGMNSDDSFFNKIIDKKNIFKIGWYDTNGKGNINDMIFNTNKIYNNIENLIKNNKFNKKNELSEKEINNLLKNNSNKIITLKDWIKINNYEIQLGKKLGKIREKLFKEKMLNLI
jgi:hypothetical protein